MRRAAVRGMAAALVSSALALGSAAHADCTAEATIAEVKAAHAQAQAAERAGRSADALALYVKAQAVTCGANPVSADAARRAAPLAQPLGAKAEKARDFAAARAYYEQGGRFADADRALVENVRAKPDAPALVAEAYAHFDARALPAFQSNFAQRLAVTGPYAPDAKLLAELVAAPRAGAERAFAREAAAYDATYLADRVRLDQAPPGEPGDLAAAQRAQARALAFGAKWPDDRLALSRAELRRVREWSLVERDRSAAARLEARRVRTLRERAATLAERYAGSPALLGAALDYEREAVFDLQQAEPRLKSLRAQARALGEAALAERRLALAASYYDVAGEPELAAAARERERQLALQRHQPEIDRAQAQAEAMRTTLGDPANAEALRQQAEAARKALEAKRKDPEEAKRHADELEAELGL